MSVSVVTDSAASMPPDDAERLGVIVVPMTLVLGGLVFSDGDLSPDEVVARAGGEPVSTSSPSAGEFLKAFATATERDDAGPAQVLVLTVSSAMSSTYEVARTAARYVDDADVDVVDTRTAAGAQGLVALAAAELAATGAPLAQVRARAEQVAREVRLVASLRDLEHLAASGRVPQAAARAGRSLGLWAMFEFRSGGVHPRRPVRSERAALERTVAVMRQSKEHHEGRAAGPGHLRAAVLQAQADEPAARLRDLILERLPGSALFEAPFSSVMIAHTGPGLVGAAWCWERDGEPVLP